VFLKGSGNMVKVVRRHVCYFDEPGKQNTELVTELVIEAVSQRLEAGANKNIVVASTSSETAAKFARTLKAKADLLYIAEAPYRQEIIAMPTSKKWWK